MGRMAILEFGGQYTDRIAHALESQGHIADILPSSAPVPQLQQYSGVVLSGGPKSVTDKDRYTFDRGLFSSGLNVLGICYGMQLLAHEHGGTVSRMPEYGRSKLRVVKDHPILNGLPSLSTTWNNHGDSVISAGDYEVLGVSDQNIVAAIAKGRNAGVQFHPELTHTDYGAQIFRNFAERCGAVSEQTAASSIDISRYAEDAMYKLRQETGARTAVVFLSGGVDSTTAYELARQAGIRTIGIHIEGVERKGEAEWVRKRMKEITGDEIYVFNYEDSVIEALAGLYDPEDERKAFQPVYSCIDPILGYLGMDPEKLVLVAGTLETDKRETGKKRDGERGVVATIKTHHNITPYWYTDRSGGKVYLEAVEPLNMLSKGEARQLARLLGLPADIAERKPFPGPGTILRRMGGIYPFDYKLEGGVASIAKAEGLEGFVLPIRTVGIKGDDRSFEHLAFITGERNWDAIRRAQKFLAEKLPINRTVYADRRWTDKNIQRSDFQRITSGIPFSRNNNRLVQEITYAVETAFDKHGVKPSQLPVIAFPGPGGIWVAVRDVQSVDFRSVRPLTPDEAPWELFDDIYQRLRDSPEVRQYGEVQGVVKDVSTKPAATTEWK